MRKTRLSLYEKLYTSALERTLFLTSCIDDACDSAVYAVMRFIEDATEKEHGSSDAVIKRSAASCLVEKINQELLEGKLTLRQIEKKRNAEKAAIVEAIEDEASKGKLDNLPHGDVVFVTDFVKSGNNIKYLSDKHRISYDDVIERLLQISEKSANPVITKYISSTGAFLNYNERQNLFEFFKLFNANIKSNSVKKIKIFKDEHFTNFDPTLEVNKVKQIEYLKKGKDFKINIMYAKSNGKMAFFTFDFAVSEETVIITSPFSPSNSSILIDVKERKKEREEIKKALKISEDSAAQASEPIVENKEIIAMQKKYAKFLKKITASDKKKLQEGEVTYKALPVESCQYSHNYTFDRFKVTLDLSKRFYEDGFSIEKGKHFNKSVRKYLFFRVAHQGFEQDATVSHYKELMKIFKIGIYGIYDDLNKLEREGLSLPGKNKWIEKYYRYRKQLVAGYLSGRSLEDMLFGNIEEQYVVLKTLYHFLMIYLLIDENGNLEKVINKTNCGEVYLTRLAEVYDELEGKDISDKIDFLKKLFGVK